jgi:hypothetical protein
MGQHYAYVQGPPPAPKDRLSPSATCSLVKMLHLTLTRTETSKDGFVGVRNAISASQQSRLVSSSGRTAHRSQHRSSCLGFQCLEDVVQGQRPWRGSISRRYDSDGHCADRQQYPYSIPLKADLAELLDWVDGVSTAAQQPCDKGNSR